MKNKWLKVNNVLGRNAWRIILDLNLPSNTHCNAHFITNIINLHALLVNFFENFGSFLKASFNHDYYFVLNKIWFLYFKSWFVLVFKFIFKNDNFDFYLQNFKTNSIPNEKPLT